MTRIHFDFVLDEDDSCLLFDSLSEAKVAKLAEAMQDPQLEPFLREQADKIEELKSKLTNRQIRETE